MIEQPIDDSRYNSNSFALKSFHSNPNHSRNVVNKHHLSDILDQGQV